MVRSAYSSGTPAIGVGPGNGPAYIEKTADVKVAVKRIMASKTFDNGTICASEQSVVCDDDMADKVQKEMESQGAYFLTREQIQKRLDPADYIGCCPEQVERFLAEHIQPVLERYPQALQGRDVEITV